MSQNIITRVTEADPSTARYCTTYCTQYLVKRLALFYILHRQLSIFLSRTTVVADDGKIDQLQLRYRSAAVFDSHQLRGKPLAEASPAPAQQTIMTSTTTPVDPSKRENPLEKSANKIIRNTNIQKRRQSEKREKGQRRRRRQRERRELGDKAPPKKEPITIESARVYDHETGESLTTEQIRDITDEFTPVLKGEVRPRVVITTGLKPAGIVLDFIAEILPVFPASTYFERLDSSVADFSRKACAKGFTDVLVVKDNNQKLSTLTHVHLPEGPSAVFKLSSFVPKKDISGHGRCTGHTPEIILNNFTTRVGVRVGRMLGCLFPHTPNFVGRQVATFHNQRDFIFFRFHRYVFNSKKDKARLQELGPRFTLKLRGLQKGIFEHPDQAEHEFKWKTRTDRNRRRFFL